MRGSLLSILLSLLGLIYGQSDKFPETDYDNYDELIELPSFVVDAPVEQETPPPAGFSAVVLPPNIVQEKPPQRQDGPPPQRQGGPPPLDSPLQPQDVSPTINVPAEETLNASKGRMWVNPNQRYQGYGGPAQGGAYHQPHPPQQQSYGNPLYNQQPAPGAYQYQQPGWGQGAQYPVQYPRQYPQPQPVLPQPQPVLPQQPQPTLFTDCGGVQTGMQGKLSSPGTAIAYPPFSYCQWIVNATRAPILLRFNKLDVKARIGGRCEDRLNVVTDEGLELELCGNQAPKLIVIPSKNARIFFASTSGGSGTGFTLNWSAGKSRSTKPAPPLSKPQPTCGKPATWPDMKGSRIVGGKTATKCSWPWQARLTYCREPRKCKQACGGALISDRWVLSAAHCFKGKLQNLKKWKVKFGDYEERKFEKTELQTTFDKLFVHENYEGHNNDIALLRLSAPVASTSCIQPVCLPERDVVDREKCFISGYGTTRNTDGDDVLKQARIPVIGDSRCKPLPSFGERITENMFCAGYLDGGIDSCQGDSGGPLVCPSADGQTFHLHGLVSWGYGCAQRNSPGVYVRVRKYLKWIEEKQRSMEGV